MREAGDVSLRRIDVVPSFKTGNSGVCIAARAP